VLAGRDRSSRLREVALAVAEAMLSVHAGDDRTGAAERMTRLGAALANGTALRRFAALTTAQGGDLKALLPVGPKATVVTAATSGVVASIDGRVLGDAVVKREAAKPAAITGIRLHKRLGDPITAGEPLADIYGDDTLAAIVGGAITIRTEKPKGPSRPAVLHRIHTRPDDTHQSEKVRRLDRQRT
jgi:thymidine phosphorylase